MSPSTAPPATDPLAIAPIAIAPPATALTGDAGEAEVTAAASSSSTPPVGLRQGALLPEAEAGAALSDEGCGSDMLFGLSVDPSEKWNVAAEGVGADPEKELDPALKLLAPHVDYLRRELLSRKQDGPTSAKAMILLLRLSQKLHKMEPIALWNIGGILKALEEYFSVTGLMKPLSLRRSVILVGWRVNDLGIPLNEARDGFLNPEMDTWTRNQWDGHSPSSKVNAAKDEAPTCAHLSTCPCNHCRFEVWLHPDGGTAPPALDMSGAASNMQWVSISLSLSLSLSFSLSAVCSRF